MEVADDRGCWSWEVEEQTLEELMRWVAFWELKKEEEDREKKRQEHRRRMQNNSSRGRRAVGAARNRGRK